MQINTSFIILPIVSMILIIFSGMLVSVSLSLSLLELIGGSVQRAYADNTIINTTSSSNFDCDPSSSCNTSNFQLATIPNGDRNEIIQNIIQKNEHCLHSSTCDESGFDVASIGETTPSFIFGDTNQNIDHISTDAKSNNDNFINQQTDNNDQNCENITSCNDGAQQFTSIGSSDHGVILNINSNNNTNVLDTRNFGVANSNAVNQNTHEVNKDCKNMQEEGCHNSSSLNSFLESSLTIGIDNFNSNHNTNIGGIRNVDSGNGNNIIQNSNLENKNCGNAAGCRNGNFGLATIANADGTFITNANNNNNTNIQNITNIGSGNVNSIIQNSNLENKNCGNAAGCFNTAESRSIIDELGNGPVSNFNANNNFILGNISNSDSGNNNEVKQIIIQDNNDCKTSLCSNGVQSLNVIGSDLDANPVANTGSNNNISFTLTNINSSNNNKIEEQSDQINSHCSNSSSCTNSGFQFANIGSPKSLFFASPLLINNANNTSLSKTTPNVNTNNNNTISQQLGQSNLCRDGSSCNNTGNLTANINGQNNQEIDQSLNQNNLCVKNSTCSNDGKIVDVSASSTQSNTCVKGSICSNVGTNNNNICTNGATCTNTGTDTKLISTGDTCNSGTDGSTTICSHGRIITISENPNLIK